MLFAKKYRYIGPEETKELVSMEASGRLINHGQDVLEWIRTNDQHVDHNDEVIATYVVTKGKKLRLADRHEEHVVCAQGEKVLSAGEITFQIDRGKVSVSEITNQSSGYCPEPRSWKYVKKALKNAGLENPGRFTAEFIFRRCDHCSNINIVKDDWYVCAVCDKDLDKKWNCDQA